MTKLDNKTKFKILGLIGIARKFIDKYNDLDTPDIVFIISAFETKFNKLTKEIQTDSFDVDAYSESIYDFDSSIFECIDSLPFKIKTYEGGNTIYDVLFSVLKGIESILDHYCFESVKSEDSEEPVENSTCELIPLG